MRRNVDFSAEELCREEEERIHFELGAEVAGEESNVECGAADGRRSTEGGARGEIAEHHG
jgi:hypothetical protein